MRPFFYATCNKIDAVMLQINRQHSICISLKSTIILQRQPKSCATNCPINIVQCRSIFKFIVIRNRSQKWNVCWKMKMGRKKNNASFINHNKTELQNRSIDWLISSLRYYIIHSSLRCYAMNRWLFWRHDWGTVYHRMYHLGILIYLIVDSPGDIDCILEKTRHPAILDNLLSTNEAICTSFPYVSYDLENSHIANCCI